VTAADAEPVAIGVLAPTSVVARLAVIPAILASPQCRLAAVASRSQPDYPAPGGARRHATYEDLIGDPEVEAVYVPLPNSMHREWTERAALAGKHVLCEKPLSTSAQDTSLMSAACAAAGVVLMEAYMTPFHPRSRTLVDLARSGRLGDVLFVSAAFTGVLDRPDDHRWQPGMGGGCLLDVGIYCLGPVLAILCPDPSDVHALRVGAASARRTSLGVDASFSGWLDLGGGRSASIQCSFEAPERQLLEIVGTEASAFVERAFTPSLEDRSISLRRRDGSVEIITTDGADPYRSMMDHFCSVIRGNAAPERTPADSIALAGLVERLFAAAGAGGPRAAR
jgi:predicted dehydrogenase